MQPRTVSIPAITLFLVALLAQGAAAEILGPIVVEASFHGESPPLADLAAAARPSRAMAALERQVPNQVFRLPRDQARVRCCSRARAAGWRRRRS